MVEPDGYWQMANVMLQLIKDGQMRADSFALPCLRALSSQPQRFRMHANAKLGTTNTNHALPWQR